MSTYSRVYARTFAVALTVAAGAACSSKLDGPTPTAASLDPPLVCVEQLTTAVTLHGSGLSPVTYDSLTDQPKVILPKIALVPELKLDGSGTSGADIAIPDDAAHVQWASQSEMVITIDPALALAAGVYGVRITNGNDQQGYYPSLLLGVAAPTLDSLDPDLLCVADGPRSVVLHGTGFLVVGSSLPVVDVGGLQLTPTYNASDCVTLPGPVGGAMLCTALTIEIPITLSTGPHTVTVTNPAPAGCTTSTPRTLYVVPPPTLLDVQPDAICLTGGSVSFTVTGTDFLQIDSAFPLVAFNDGLGDVYQANPASMNGCTPMAGPVENVQVCTSFQITLPQDTSATSRTTFDVRVINPMPAGCDSNTLPVTNFPPPTVTSPSSTSRVDMCAGGGSIVITGTNLRVGAAVSLWENFNNRTNGLFAGNVEPVTCSDITDPTSACTQIRADFGFMPGSLVSVSPVDLVVGNIDGCEAQIANAVNIIPGPLALSAEPEILYDGFDNTVTVYVTNFPGGGPVERVHLLPPAPDSDILLCQDGTAMPCNDVGSPSGAFTVNIPGGLLVTLTGTPADVTFGMRITANSALTCGSALLPGAVRIVSQTTPAQLAMTPQFGKVGEATAVTITEALGQLLSTPRAYLSNSTSGGPLRAVAFVSAAALSAVVPDTFTLSCSPPCSEKLNLTVVNPNAQIFVLADAFTLSTYDPPRIDTITPGQLPGSAASTVSVTGAFFSNTPADPTAELVGCRDAAGNTIAGATLGVTYVDAQDLTLSVPARPVNTSCLVKITNAQDGAFDLFASLVFMNSSGNIPVTRPSANNLNTPRRGHGVVSVPATRAQHVLYVAGGDSGSPAGALDSVEYALLDLFTGQPSPFVTARYSLPAPRTFLGLSRAGNALYVLGGADSGGVAQTMVTRAVVLDPSEAVTLGIDSFAFGSLASPGLGQGAWIYRVSIVFADNDGINPCGESLPSEPFNIRLPNVSDGLTLTLRWTEANGANLGTRFTNRQVAGYRVYRSVQANASLAEAAFLNDVDGATTITYFDDGQPVTAPNTISGCGGFAPLAGQTPLALGETSRWVSAGVPQVNVARKGAAVLAVPDKASNNVFLYAMSGVDPSGAGLDDYELLLLAYEPTTNPLLWEAASSWARATGALANGTAPCAGSTARWHAGLSLFNHENSSLDGVTYAITNDEQYVYLGPGRNAADSANLGVFQSWRIGAGGILAGYDFKCQTAALVAGYGNIGTNRQVFVFGGNSAAPTHVRAAEWSRVTAGADPPRISINPVYGDNGTDMQSPRYLHGTALDRAYIYLVGGDTTPGGTPTVTRTVEFGLW